MPERKERRKRATPKQLAARRLFTRRVHEAQKYRESHPRTTMAQAMKIVSR